MQGGRDIVVGAIILNKVIWEYLPKQVPVQESPGKKKKRGRRDLGDDSVHTRISQPQCYLCLEMDNSLLCGAIPGNG